MRMMLLTTSLLFAFAGTAVAAPVTYKIDPNHTNVLASWTHMGFSNPTVNFGKAEGNIVYDAQKASASSVQVKLPLSGLSALAENFYDHLTSDGWFDAAKYPDATFRSTKVESAGANKLKVTGDLTIKGVTKPVVLSVSLNGQGPHPMTKAQSIGFDATGTIKRSDFGLGKYAPNVSDEVRLRITTEASVAKAK